MTNELQADSGGDRSTVGVVVIGRNEGERLRACLESLRGLAGAVVYVDSASTDGSVDLAVSEGVGVVELDLSEPFTVGRARNTGFWHLVEAHPALQYVQFIDADCVMAPGWIERARSELADDPELAAVSGRRRERSPDASRYHRLIEMEWQRELGEALSCGGDSMMSVEAFREAGGHLSLMAGEDTELSYRMRQKGWRIRQLDVEMSMHDARMFRLSQWWRRTKRTGYSYAEGAALHGAEPERFCVRQVLSALFWGLGLPAAGLALLAAAWARPQLLWLVALIAVAYGVLFARIYRYRRRRGNTSGDSRLYAAYCVLAKLPEQLGILSYALDRLRGRSLRLIEYRPAS